MVKAYSKNSRSIAELASKWGPRASFSVADQALVSGANFALNIALARWLSADGYGGFAVVYSFFLFISGFHNALIIEPMSVVGASRAGESMPGYLGSLFWIQVAGLLMLSWILVAIVSFASLSSSLAGPLWGLALTLPALLLYWFLRQACYLKTRPASAFYGGLAYSAFVLAGLVLLHVSGSATAFNGFVILGLSSAAASAVLWRLLSRIGGAPVLKNADPIHAVMVEQWSYGRWVLGSALVYGLGNFFYVPLLSALGSLSQAGALRAMQNLIAPLQQLLTAFNRLWLPWAARQAQDRAGSPGLRSALLTISGLMTAAAVVYAVLLVSSSELVSSFLYGQGAYDEYLWIIPYLSLAMVIGAVNNGLMLSLKALNRPDRVLFSQIVAALLTLSVGTLLVWRWGVLGVAIGSIVSSMAAGLFLGKQLRTLFNAAMKSPGPGHGSEKRIAWLVPSMDRGSYWHPVFREFVRLFPYTVVFTGSWPGFASGSENAFAVRVIGRTRYFNLRSFVSGKTRTFIIPSLAIVPGIIRYRPEVIFASAFSLWSAWAAVLKPWKKWHLVIFYDGSAPSVDCIDSRLKIFFRRLITKNADALVSNSHAGRKYLTEVLGADHSKVFRRPYQVPCASALLAGNTDAAKPLALQLQRPVFLFIGQLIPRKGLDFLLDACALLNQQGRSSFTVLIAGDGPKRKDLEEKITSRNLSHEVRLIGWIDYAQLGNYMKLADVFVFPTLEDIWGMVILEAMVFGKPILCSKWAGTSEMVLEGENGFVFDPYQPEQLAGLMRRFIDDPRVIASMGERSVSLIAPHNPVTAAEGLAGVVSHVLQTRRTREPAGAGVCFE